MSRTEKFLSCTLSLQLPSKDLADPDVARNRPRLRPLHRDPRLDRRFPQGRRARRCVSCSLFIFLRGPITEHYPPRQTKPPTSCTTARKSKNSGQRSSISSRAPSPRSCSMVSPSTSPRASLPILRPCRRFCRAGMRSFVLVLLSLPRRWLISLSPLPTPGHRLQDQHDPHSKHHQILEGRPRRTRSRRSSRAHHLLPGRPSAMGAARDQGSANLLGRGRLPFRDEAEL